MCPLACTTFGDEAMAEAAMKLEEVRGEERGRWAMCDQLRRG